jgi:hypothetical protein
VVTDSTRLELDVFEKETGWALRPEGACRGDICVPLSGRELPELAERLSLAVVHDAEEGLWCLGPAIEPVLPAGARAPDWELPDLDGRLHSRSEHLGRKLLVLAWAPW